MSSTIVNLKTVVVIEPISLDFHSSAQYLCVYPLTSIPSCALIPVSHGHRRFLLLLPLKLSPITIVCHSKFPPSYLSSDTHSWSNLFCAPLTLLWFVILHHCSGSSLLQEIPSPFIADNIVLFKGINATSSEPSYLWQIWG